MVWNSRNKKYAILKVLPSFASRHAFGTIYKPAELKRTGKYHYLFNNTTKTETYPYLTAHISYLTPVLIKYDIQK